MDIEEGKALKGKRNMNNTERKAAKNLRRLSNENIKIELEISTSYKETVSDNQTFNALENFKKSIFLRVVKKLGVVY